MSDEPSHEEAHVTSGPQEQPASEGATAQPDPHQQVLDAAREAEEAVAASALSPGLSHSHKPDPTNQVA